MTQTPFQTRYSAVALPHLEGLIKKNKQAMRRIVRGVIANVRASQSLFVFGSGHSTILALELFHRAGGPSFVIPMLADFLLPTSGPAKVRKMERTPGVVNELLDHYGVRSGEMLWIFSQSGINGAGIDLAIEAKKKGIYVVSFSSHTHSRSLPSRHPSGKKLFEVSDEKIDLVGFVGDASVKISQKLKVGPLSTLSAIFLAHSILVEACTTLELEGVGCVYTSVNTPEGEARNKKLEESASKRDPRLREDFA